MRVLSLGWGVQSFTLAAMAALGDIEPVAAAVHADTMHERETTYAFAEKWTPWLERHGVRVVTVTNPTGGVWEIFKRLGQTHVPAYTRIRRDGPTQLIEEYTWTWGEDGDEYEVPTGRMIEVKPTDSDGQLRRSCTHRWKIVPLRRWLQANRNGENVEQLLGISLDEWHRAKDSDVSYITHRHPLLDQRMTRADCIAYLRRNGLEVPNKSSCTFCPYHNRAAWEELKRQGGRDWDEAISVDAALRNARPPYELYIHSARKPLPEAVRIPEDEGATQLTMLDDTACDSGYCFL